MNGQPYVTFTTPGAKLDRGTDPGQTLAPAEERTVP
jgi:hypothetical protein